MEIDRNRRKFHHGRGNFPVGEEIGFSFNDVFLCVGKESGKNKEGK
jgi:hypothetical protein